MFSSYKNNICNAAVDFMCMCMFILIVHNNILRCMYHLSKVSRTVVVVVVILLTH